jgi:hypoxanthine phosphoribosyltransferase
MTHPTYTYTYAEYLSDLDTLSSKLKKIDNLHLVAVYRGSLPIATHLSNILNCDFSIIKLQTRDGDDDAATFLHNSIQPESNVVVLEDIYDTGKTIRLIQNLMISYKSVKYIALYGNTNNDGVEYLREQSGRWIIFPWEVQFKSLSMKNIPDYWKPENN